VYQDLTLARHAKGGLRRDALHASTYTSHFTSFCSLALHGTSVFRLNALRVIKWFLPLSSLYPERGRSIENASSKMQTLARNDPTLRSHYVRARLTRKYVSHRARVPRKRAFNSSRLSRVAFVDKLSEIAAKSHARAQSQSGSLSESLPLFANVKASL
jgi:hypothetical protein